MIGAANLLFILSFVVFDAVSRQYPHGQHRPLPTVLFSFGALVLGLSGTLIAESNLRKGIASDRWPDGLLDAPRKILAHPAFFILTCLLIVASFVYIIFSFSRSGRFIGGAWMFIYPVMSLTRVQRLTSTMSSDHRSRTDPPKPLQSEHWGD
jgi:hypothetical protein